MPNSEADRQNKKRACRKRADTLLIFDPAQKVPDAILTALIEEWLVPCLVERFLHERDLCEAKMPTSVP